MGTPYIGEIRLFAGNYAPNGWAFCDGQQIPIAENDALFTLIGITYGGDGQENFNLPDLRGRVPVHVGQGPGLTNRPLGIAGVGGVESVTLTTNQIPSHGHPLTATGNTANDTLPSNNVLARTTASVYLNAGPVVNMSPSAVAPVGGSQPHTNLQPFLCINFILSLFGVFPSQT